jgi:hypothetical protein
LALAHGRASAFGEAMAKTETAMTAAFSKRVDSFIAKLVIGLRAVLDAHQQKGKDPDIYCWLSKLQ